MQFPQVLKSLMNSRGLSNYQLAKELDIHPTTVANWLDGKLPRKKTQLELATYFNVSVDYLMGDEQEKPAQAQAENSELDQAFFRVMKSAQEKGYSAHDIELAMDFIKRARERDQK